MSAVVAGESPALPNTWLIRRVRCACAIEHVPPPAGADVVVIGSGFGGSVAALRLIGTNATTTDEQNHPLQTNRIRFRVTMHRLEGATIIWMFFLTMITPFADCVARSAGYPVMVG